MPMPPTKSDFWPFAGGWDIETPGLTIPPGPLRETENFEADINGGYTRIHGYERFDGRPQPSAQLYFSIPATVTGSPVFGDTITGATSGATAVVLQTGTDRFYVGKVVGSFVAAETLNVGGSPVGTSTDVQSAGGATSIQHDAQLLNLCADLYRADITAVPGSGPVRGVGVLNDIVYAFRDNAGATALDLYKSTAGGWVQVAFEYEISFTAGNGSVDDGDTLTQGANTATVRRVMVESGSLAGGTAAGRLIISAPAPGSFAAGAATTTGGGTLTLSGAQTAITMLPGGRLELITENFGGGIQTKRMYGADGINRAFEFDGTIFAPIRTGMATDAPKFITVHKLHLFLSFDSSVQHSGPATPYVFNVVLGAGEIGAGDTVTGFLPQSGSETSGALLITTRNKAFMLYGNSAADWNFVEIKHKAGAMAYSLQDAGMAVALDDTGVITISATQEFGNFTKNTISDRIQAWISQQKTKIQSSAINREKRQYRLFFSDKYALYITLSNNNLIGMMPELFEHKVNVITSAEFSDGTEQTYFGSDDGFVYRLDVGSSFDGAPISWRFVTHYNHSKSPRLRKRYRSAMLEVTGTAYAAFSVGYKLGYSSTDIDQPVAQDVSSSFAPVFWDSFVWDSFFWDGVTLAPNVVRLDGTAENIALAITGSSDEIMPFTLTGAVLSYTPRRALRF